MFKGFKEFILRGNAIDLAVGVIIGAAFSNVVTALVNGLISPLIAALFGQPSFDALGNFTLGAGEFALGSIITVVVNFILVAIALYFCIIVPMNYLARVGHRKAKDPEPAEATPSEVEVLQRIERLLAEQHKA